MSAVVMFHSRSPRQRLYIGPDRIEFSGHIYRTDDQKIISALRDRIRRPLSKRGLLGEVSEVKPPALPTPVEPPEAKPEEKPDEKPAPKKK